MNSSIVDLSSVFPPWPYLCYRNAVLHALECPPSCELPSRILTDFACALLPPLLPFRSETFRRHDVPLFASSIKFLPFSLFFSSKHLPFILSFRTVFKMQVTLFTLLAANAVFATPIYKRQSEVVTQVTSVLSEAVPTQVAATNPISLPINSVTPDISAISTMTGAIESAQPGMEPSAMSSGDGSEDSDSSASASASASGSDVFSLAYPCPDGTQLVGGRCCLHYILADDKLRSTSRLSRTSMPRWPLSTMLFPTLATAPCLMSPCRAAPRTRLARLEKSLCELASLDSCAHTVSN